MFLNDTFGVVSGEVMGTGTFNCPWSVTAITAGLVRKAVLLFFFFFIVLKCRSIVRLHAPEISDQRRRISSSRSLLIVA